MLQTARMPNRAHLMVLRDWKETCRAVGRAGRNLLALLSGAGGLARGGWGEKGARAAGGRAGCRLIGWRTVLYVAW